MGGGSNLFEGVQLLIPIETHITCDFPGGGGGQDHLSPSLDLHLRLKELSEKNSKDVLDFDSFGMYPSVCGSQSIVTI